MRGLSVTNPQAEQNGNGKGKKKSVLSLSHVSHGGRCAILPKEKGEQAERGEKISLFYLSGVELQAGRARGQDLGGVGDGSTHIFIGISEAAASNGARR
jgi:hypothetical protein